MSEKLLPCCHCGTEKEGTEPIIIGGAYQVVCQECQSSTGLHNTPEEAIAAWNRHFVCLDSNGKKVFKGDRVVCSIGDRVYPVHDTVIISENTPYLRTRAVTLHEWWIKIGGEITLIESEDRT